MPPDSSSPHRFCDDLASGRGRELLALYESACHDSLEIFEHRALTRLGRLVGFDGAVWGRGSPLPGGKGVRIDTATLLDRDTRLLSDYGATGQADPVAGNFFARPDSVQTIDVGAFYRGRGRERIGDCLAAHDVAHVLLAGGRDARGGGREVFSWVTAYRREAAAAFGPAEARRYAELLPHWVQAREICAELSRARARPAAAVPGAPFVAAPPPTVARRVADALSRREAEVLVYVSRGFTYVETAALIGISSATVRSHVRNLYGKLGVHTKTEAVFEARALGWLD